MGDTIAVTDGVKGRFDSFQRRLQAELDENLNQSETLEYLLETHEDVEGW